MADTPVPKVLHCPSCGGQHIDRDEWATTRIHRTHLCEHCGGTFRPFEFSTVGVEKTADTCDSCGEELKGPEAQLLGPSGRKRVCGSCYDGLEKALFAGSFVRQPVKVALELVPGAFYRSLNDDVWCCFRVEPKERDAYQAFCVRVKDGLVEHHYSDGRHLKVRDYWLISTVSTAVALRAAATWLDKGQASPL